MIEAQAAWAKWRAEMRDLGYTREEIAEMMAEDSEWTAMRACDPVQEGAAPAQGARAAGRGCPPGCGRCGFRP